MLTDMEVRAWADARGRFSVLTDMEVRAWPRTFRVHYPLQLPWNLTPPMEHHAPPPKQRFGMLIQIGFASSC